LDTEEQARLVARLREWGATEDELADAVACESLGGLALDLAVRPPGPVLSFAEAAAQSGLDPEDAARYWRALGFPDPRTAEPRLTTDAVRALALVTTTGRALLGEDATLALARVLGAAMWRTAQAVLDAFRARFEAPQLAAGVSYQEVVESYVGFAGEVLPQFTDAMSAVFLRHLVAVAAGTWSVDAEGTATEREAAVGFADLVGYSTVAHTMSSAQLARVIDRFEDVVAEAASTHGGRVVKLIGDGAMFSAGDAVRAGRIAWEIAERVAGSDDLPPVRVGLASGPVVGLYGDLYGDVVNLAARLVAVADEGTVVVDDAVRQQADGEFAFVPLPSRSLKGFGADTAAYRLTRP
jgi:adenylate cyclase